MAGAGGSLGGGSQVAPQQALLHGDQRVLKQGERSEALSLVEISQDCALIGWILTLLHQPSYAIKTQLKAPNGSFRCVFMA